MVGESQVLYLALFPFLYAPIKAVVLLICIVVISVLNTVKEVEIEEINAASIELLIEDLIPVFK